MIGGLRTALALTGAAQAQAPAAHGAHAAPPWEVSAALGHDFDSDQNLWAVALGRRFGEGWKGVFEFADGKHGSHGSYVTSLKAMKELERSDTWEFGLGAGGVHVEGDHHSGRGEIDSVRAPVVQAGAVFKV